jgi:GMP synthase (glutamine-hydrolysing)
MRILLIDNGTSYLAQLEQLLGGHQKTIIPFSTVFLAHREHFDLVILTGGYKFAVAGHDQEYQREMDFILQSNLPTIGICLGCQLIAHAYGSDLVEMPEKQRGIIQIKQIAPDPIFNNLPETDISVYESHRWVVSRLGEQMHGLARSDDGFEIVKHSEKPIYGLQFHPEMMPDKALGDEIFNNIVTTITS